MTTLHRSLFLIMVFVVSTLAVLHSASSSAKVGGSINSENIRILLREGDKCIGSNYCLNCSTIFLAARNNHPACLTAHITENKDLVDAKSEESGSTPLMIAVMNDSRECINILLAQKAQKNIVNLYGLSPATYTKASLGTLISLYKLECAVCLSSLQAEEADDVVMLPCHPHGQGVPHIFHTDCIAAWFAGGGSQGLTCPSCREKCVDKFEVISPEKGVQAKEVEKLIKIKAISYEELINCIFNMVKHDPSNATSDTNIFHLMEVCTNTYHNRNWNRVFRVAGYFNVTFLGLALIHNKLSLATKIINAGANVNLPCYSLQSAILFALSRKNIAHVSWAIKQRNFDINAVIKALDNVTVLHHLVYTCSYTDGLMCKDKNLQLRKAEGFKEIIRILLDAGADLMATNLERNDSPLAWIAEAGNVVLAEQLYQVICEKHGKENGNKIFKRLILQRNKHGENAIGIANRSFREANGFQGHHSVSKYFDHCLQFST